MGDIAGSVGSVVGGFMGSSSAKKAASKQAKAIAAAMERLKKDLDPTFLNDQALKFDLERAQNRLEAQQTVDPEIYAQRRLSEKMLTEQLQALQGETPSDRIATMAAEEAAQAGPGTTAAKQALIDAALEELAQGATLPADVQAEFMKAGLETAGRVTGEAASRGAGANILRQTLGLGALNLKAQRQLQAQKMLETASGIDAQRQQVLQSLFPNLLAQQANKAKTTSGFLQQSETMLPEAGLSGGDITNLWLARTGALNQMALNRAGVKAQGDLTSGLMKAGAVGTAASSAVQALPSLFGLAFPGIGSLSSLLKGGTPGTGNASLYP